MDNFMLKVKCPNNGSECSIVGGEIMESMVLLGDNEQNMQCLACGYASNSNMKTSVQPLPKDFKDVCVETDKGRFWAPSVFTTENYNVVPMVDDGKLKWKIFAHADPKTEVFVPTFSDAFKMVEKLEKLIEHKIQQSQNN